MAQRNEIEAMDIICNIQAMQRAIWGDAARYDQYKNNTVDELRAIQSELLKAYNEKLATKNNLTN
jgi:hypothetical protein